MIKGNVSPKEFVTKYTPNSAVISQMNSPIAKVSHRKFMKLSFSLLFLVLDIFCIYIAHLRADSIAAITTNPIVNNNL